jgi:hypothetical protein
VLPSGCTTTPSAVATTLEAPAFGQRSASVRGSVRLQVCDGTDGTNVTDGTDGRENGVT